MLELPLHARLAEKARLQLEVLAAVLAHDLERDLATDARVAADADLAHAALAEDGAHLVARLEGVLLELGLAELHVRRPGGDDEERRRVRDVLRRLLRTRGVERRAVRELAVLRLDVTHGSEDSALLAAPADR